jgi:hypothetical protein
MREADAACDHGKFRCTKRLLIPARVAWPRARSRKTSMPGKALHWNRSRNGRCFAATACVQQCFSILIIDKFAWINRQAESSGV